MNAQTKSNLLSLKSATVVRLEGFQSYFIPIGFVATAVAAPAVCHLIGAPVRLVLPMHWPILLAGLLYGWRVGLLTGSAAPLSNWIITGFPLPMVLPAMTMELAVYGFLSGWLVEKWKWNRFLAISAAILAGRMIFLSAVLLTHGYQGSFSEYLPAAMLPGLVGAVGQIITIPIIVKVALNRSEEHL